MYFCSRFIPVGGVRQNGDSSPRVSSVRPDRHNVLGDLSELGQRFQIRILAEICLWLLLRSRNYINHPMGSSGLHKLRQHKGNAVHQNWCGCFETFRLRRGTLLEELRMLGDYVLCSSYNSVYNGHKEESGYAGVLGFRICICKYLLCSVMRTCERNLVWTGPNKAALT